MRPMSPLSPEDTVDAATGTARTSCATGAQRSAGVEHRQRAVTKRGIRMEVTHASEGDEQVCVQRVCHRSLLGWMCAAIGITLRMARRDPTLNQACRCCARKQGVCGWFQGSRSGLWKTALTAPSCSDVGTVWGAQALLVYANPTVLS